MLIMGSGAGSRVWHSYQVPALVASGYEAVTFDNRGVPPSESPTGRYALEDLVADAIALLEHLDLGAVRLAGVSLGSVVAQEVALARPDLVRAAVFMATKARADTVRRAMTDAAIEVLDEDAKLPVLHTAVTNALQMLSPRTLDDDAAMADWLELFSRSAHRRVGVGQLWADLFPDRREALRGIRAPCMVIAFEDDLITPPKLCQEVANAIDGCEYVQLPGCGHLGYLERPKLVNDTLVRFFAST